MQLGQATATRSAPVARAYVRMREKMAVRRNETPSIASAFFEYGARNCYYDHAKAVRELGLSSSVARPRRTQP